MLADQDIEKCNYYQKILTGLNNHKSYEPIEFCKIKNITPRGGNRNTIPLLFILLIIIRLITFGFSRIFKMKLTIIIVKDT